jgi:hypothetical protein
MNPLRGAMKNLPTVLAIFFRESTAQNPSLTLPHHVFSLSVKCGDEENARQARQKRAEMLQCAYQTEIPVPPRQVPAVGNCAEAVAIIVARSWTGLVGFVALALNQDTGTPRDTKEACCNSRFLLSLEPTKYPEAPRLFALHTEEAAWRVLKNALTAQQNSIAEMVKRATVMAMTEKDPEGKRLRRQLKRTPQADNATGLA